MRTCNKCKESKELLEFFKNKTKKDGYQTQCKTCCKEYHKAWRNTPKGKTAISGYVKKYHETPKGKAMRKDSLKKFRQTPKGKELKAITDKKYHSKPEVKAKRKVIRNKLMQTPEGRGRESAKRAKRRAAKLQRTPPWLTKEQLKEIEEIYALAKELQWLSEEPLHVDHIIPLQGENVSGLHVPWNLQILPRSLNLSKNNNF